MQKTSSTTAVLVFSHTASDEATLKTFHTQAGKLANQAIARRFIRQTIATAHHSGLPVLVHFTSPSIPFGHALADALEAVFARGYANVIAIGNDCPDLDAQRLLHTAAMLAHEPLVLGPAWDGGVYLIGIQKAAYHRPQLVSMAWQTAQLQADFGAYASHFGLAPIWLDAQTDIDHPEDFSRWLERLPRWNLLKKWFLSLLASRRLLQKYTHAGYRAAALCSHTPWRGPPAAQAGA